jgi:hypothetical protein
VDHPSGTVPLRLLLSALLLIAALLSGCESDQHDTAIGPDETAELQARLDATPDGGTLRLKSGAEYLVNGILWIDRRSDLTIEGNGATLHVPEPCGLGCGPNGRGWRRTVWIRDSSNIQLRNLNVVGPTGGAVLDPAYEGEHGFIIEGGRDIALRNVTVTHVGGDGFYIIPSKSTGGRTSDVTIDGAVVQDVGRHGMGIIDGDAITLTRSLVDGVRSFVDIEPHLPTNLVTDVRITHNRVGETRNVFFAAAGSGVVRDVAVRHNHAFGAPLQMGIGNRASKPPRSDFDISYNSSDVPLHLPYVNLVRVTGVEGLRFVGNVQPFESVKQAALRDYGSCDVYAGDNRLRGAGMPFRGPADCDWIDGGGNELA